MNGNYLFNQVIARQRIQERLREAEAHRLLSEAALKDQPVKASNLNLRRPAWFTRLFGKQAGLAQTSRMARLNTTMEETV
jgi:hypothetical protein